MRVAVMQNQRNISGWGVKVAVGLLLVGIVAFLVFVPPLLVNNISPEVPPREVAALVNEYRRTWAQIIGGLGLLVGLFLTWRRVEISDRTLEATRDQQITERFTRAIDQLGKTDDNGAPRLEIRLGGIYALERIAADSLGRDYSTVMEVLTAYVRENASWNSRELESWGPSPEMPLELDRTTPSTDIQAIIEILRRRQEHMVSEKHRVRLDLRRTDLRSANLEGVNLEGANLEGTNLAGSNLEGANLREAQLNGANLEGADLRGADLSEIIVTGANFRGANFFEAKLRSLTIFKSNLSDANFINADFNGAMLSDVVLSGANFYEADMRFISLTEAHDMTQEQLDEVIGGHTELPEHLTPLPWWSKDIAEQKDLLRVRASRGAWTPDQTTNSRTGAAGIRAKISRKLGHWLRRR